MLLCYLGKEWHSGWTIDIFSFGPWATNSLVLVYDFWSLLYVLKRSYNCILVRYYIKKNNIQQTQKLLIIRYTMGRRQDKIIDALVRTGWQLDFWFNLDLIWPSVFFITTPHPRGSFRANLGWHKFMLSKSNLGAIW